MIFIVSSTSIMPTLAETKPSIPEITVAYTDNSYDVPSSSSVDSFSGEITIHQGGHVKNGSIQLTISNQEYNSYYDSNGHLIKLYNHIRMKDHSKAEWHYSTDLEPKYFPVENAKFVAVFPVTDNNVGNKIISTSGKVDFSVEAFLGYSTKVITGGDPIILRPGDYHYDFYGEVSGWSNTQTVDINTGEVTTSQTTNTPTPVPPTINPTTTIRPILSPTETPAQANSELNVASVFDWKDLALAITCGVIAALAAAIVLSRRKRA
jgi:hypothetical protein